MARGRSQRSGRIGLAVWLSGALALLQMAAAAPAGGTHPAGSVLPDLVMLAPKDFSVEKRPKGKRWLRFDTVIANIGPGRFEVYGYQHADDPSGTLRVVQRIESGAGSWAEHDSPAAMTFAGDGHNHWHVIGLQSWILTNDRNERLGSGAKTGFCFWDNFRYGSSAGAYYLPSTTSACARRADSIVPMGLSVGWGDEYPSTITFQYIDISGLPFGEYTVQVQADAGGAFVEADETTNNLAWSRIRIARRGVTVIDSGLGPLP